MREIGAILPGYPENQRDALRHRPPGMSSPRLPMTGLTSPPPRGFPTRPGESTFVAVHSVSRTQCVGYGNYVGRVNYSGHCGVMVLRREGASRVFARLDAQPLAQGGIDQ